MKNEKIKNRCKKAIKTLRNWTKRKQHIEQTEKTKYNDDLGFRVKGVLK